MRIGLFGGTFNPVHLGHLRAALEVKEGFELSKIFLIPAALPPHKIPGDVVDVGDRLQMLNLALEDTVEISVSDIELKRSGPSYTIDSVKYFKSTLPEKSKIYLVMGLDAFLEIDSWKSYEELLQQVSIIVINRPKKDRLFSGDGWKRLDEYLISGISGGYKFSESQSCYQSPDKQPIFIFEVTALDISSTKIRSLIKAGRSIGYLVPRKTAEFIKSRGLYI
ncbi:MAG: nicotinate-nucleotide adenylyltransferase [Desulfobacterales bacterium]|jgi:nicotinate-nucleotide adenylyltransferase